MNADVSQIPRLLQQQYEQRAAGTAPDVSDPKIRATVPLVWSLSDFVAVSCQRSPELLPELDASGELLRCYDAGELQQKLEKAAQDCRSEEELKRVLRQQRRREMVRIAWRDLAGWADLQEVVNTVSELADASIIIAQRFANADLAEKHGQPLDEQGQPMALCVIGMGKLGAGELNFSSDIDLIFAYPEDGETGGKRPLTHREYFIRLGKKLVQLLGETTADGFVFRVDMRLRPNGNSGALALSFDAMDHYYLTHGREWERYALVKARAITGGTSAADLMQRLKPFVYRKYIDFTVVENLRELKNRIEHELKRKGVQHNIKLGPGGIREIEFVAQAWQLIRGGREPDLQDRRLLVILQRLAQKRLLPEAVAKQLRDAYVYLRRLEHRLQMINDQQTQALPESELDQCRIATAMGYGDWDEFMQDWLRVSAGVQSVFDDMFGADENPEGDEDISPYAGVWLESLEPGEAEAVLREGGYTGPEAVGQLLAGLRSGRAWSAFSAEAKDRMDRLMPRILELCGRSPHPNTTLQRLVQILEAIGRRTSYIALLAENPSVLEQLIQLSSASAWIASWIARHPLLLDELFDPRLLFGDFSEDSARDELRQLLSHLPEDDLEGQMNALREFRHAQVLRVAAADVSANLEDREISRRLCQIAEICLQACFDMAWTELVRKYGEPGSMAATGQRGFIVVGYGKLGSLEMGYTSDLDLVFIHRQVAPASITRGERAISDVTFYQRLAQKIVQLATVRTHAGRLYEVDVRLRPNGLSGAPASGLQSWTTYQLEKAWIWEHQALVRARAVVGEAQLAADFAERRAEIIRLPREAPELKKAILDMREKMRREKPGPADAFDIKSSRGGMVDIDFLVQYLVLLHAAAVPSLAQATETLILLQELAQSGVLDRADAEKLSATWSLYLETEHRNKLMEEAPVVDSAEFQRCREHVAHVWERVFYA